MIITITEIHTPLYTQTLITRQREHFIKLHVNIFVTKYFLFSLP